MFFPKEKPNSLAKSATVGFTIIHVIVNLSPGLTVKVQGQHSGSHMGAGDGLVTDGEYLAGAAGLSQDGGQVQRRIRSNKVILGAFRPAYDIEEKEDEDVVTYKYLKDVPEKFRPTIDQLMTAGIIQGDGSDPTGNGDVINLTHEQVRTLVFVYRGGGFDRKLRAAGLAAAVQ